MIKDHNHHYIKTLQTDEKHANYTTFLDNKNYINPDIHENPTNKHHLHDEYMILQKKILLLNKLQEREAVLNTAPYTLHDTL
ncbi:hypothetical protein BG621_03455 [Parasaccharibacter apium]|nr:hypothetical protein BG621_03455 [Parasaccharibacter apium]